MCICMIRVTFVLCPIQGRLERDAWTADPVKTPQSEGLTGKMHSIQITYLPCLTEIIFHEA